MFNFSKIQGRVNKENEICLFIRLATIKELLRSSFGKCVEKQAI